MCNNKSCPFNRADTHSPQREILDKARSTALQLIQLENQDIKDKIQKAVKEALNNGIRLVSAQQEKNFVIGIKFNGEIIGQRVRVSGRRGAGDSVILECADI